MRERVGRRVTPAASLASDPSPTPGFVSQTSLSPAEQPEPPASPRAAINRANAQHSTGPSTPEGKLASSRNSLKHGLASGTLIIPGEDQAAFASLLDSLLAEHQPANATEEMLIREMAQSFWLTQRALRLQNECFTEDAVNEKRLALFLRYYTTHQRAFHKALNTLMRLQKERRRENRGFVSQPHASTESQSGFVSQNPAHVAHPPHISRPETIESPHSATRAA